MIAGIEGVGVADLVDEVDALLAEDELNDADVDTAKLELELKAGTL